jgi:hypothetical protein
MVHYAFVFELELSHLTISLPALTKIEGHKRYKYGNYIPCEQERYRLKSCDWPDSQCCFRNSLSDKWMRQVKAYISAALFPAGATGFPRSEYLKPDLQLNSVSR